MKISHKIALLATLVLCGGCTGEDPGNCSGTNDVLIKFRDVEAGVDVFDRNISRVNLFIFDKKTGQFVLSKQIEQSSLNAAHGTLLSLPVGEYRVVCWGNAYEHSQFSSLDQGATIYDQAQTNISNHCAESGDHTGDDGDELYYAPYTNSDSFLIITPGVTDLEYEIDFRAAHVKIDIYVTGFTDPSNLATNLSPSIEFTNLPPKYNFNLEAFGEPVTYKKTTIKKTVDGIATEFATFSIPLFETSCNTRIILRKNSDSQVVESKSLAEFVLDHYPDLDLWRPETIHLELEFKYINGQITIALPAWKDDVIIPEI